jgi:transcriptional repressor NrdR
MHAGLRCAWSGEDVRAMKCPVCSSLENRVVDSRLSKEGNVIRRRRACQECEWRFTTYERLEEYMPLVVKKDGRREPFERNKLLAGIKKACEKRPVALSTMEAVVRKLERTLCDRGEREVASQVIGEQVMRALHEIDAVAYVRFASVYRSFKDITEFMQEIHDLLEGKPAQRHVIQG